jgi:hypothetical protein
VRLDFLSEAWKRGLVEALFWHRSRLRDFRRGVVASRDLLFTQSSNPWTASFRLFSQAIFDQSTATLFGGDLPLSDWKNGLSVLDFSLHRFRPPHDSYRQTMAPRGIRGALLDTSTSSFRSSIRAGGHEPFSTRLFV